MELIFMSKANYMGRRRDQALNRLLAVPFWIVESARAKWPSEKAESACCQQRGETGARRKKEKRLG